MKTHKDLRIPVLIATLLAVAACGLMIRWLPDIEQSRVSSSATPPSARQSGVRASAGVPLLQQRFQQAVALLHARRYDHAVTVLREVLALAPRLPEAHVNMGYALLGLDRPRAAADFFNSALNLRTSQVNAYYGLAVALERQNDLHGALGAMRSFTHLAAPADPYLRKARAALWEWETKLRRIATARLPRAKSDAKPAE